MRFKIYFLLSIILLFACSNNEKKNAQEITNYPTYYEIVYEFFSHYSVPRMEDYPVNLYINFEKNAKGIEVVLKNYNDDKSDLKEKERYLFWDKKHQKYNELDLPVSNFDPDKKSVFYTNEINFSDYASPIANINYDLHYYYGYPEWGSDFLDDFEDYVGSDSKIRYTLAQAFLSKIFNYSIYRANDDVKGVTIEDWKNALEGVGIMEEMLKEEIPLKTMVGGLKNKISNDIIGIMYINRYAGWGFDEANMLDRVCYDKTFLETVKLYLNSCPENSILITSGDNDTYPLLYLQWKLGIRKDVTIMNSSLLSLNEYFNYIANKDKINYEIDSKLLEERDIRYALIDKMQDNYDNFEDFKSDLFTKSFRDAPVVAQKIKINQLDSTYNLSIKSSYISLSDIRMIDLLSNNNRPLCFTYGSHYFENDPGVLYDWAVYSHFGKVSKEDQVQLALKNLKILNNIDPKKIYRFDEFNAYSSPYNFFYYSAMKILRENELNDELLKYAQNYYKILSPKENINRIDGLIFSVINDHPATALLAREIAEIGKKSIYAEVRSKFDDNDWLVNKITEVSKLVGLLGYFDKLLGETNDNIFQIELIDFFDELYQQKPHFKQVVLNQRELHEFLSKKD